MPEHHDGSFQQRGSEDMAQPSGNSIIFHSSPLLEMEHSSPSKKWKVLKKISFPYFTATNAGAHRQLTGYYLRHPIVGWGA